MRVPQGRCLNGSVDGGGEAEGDVRRYRRWDAL